MNHTELIQKLTLDEKCALLSGGTQFGTKALARVNIPAIACSDGPHGLRKQAGAADHLGLNGSQPATCFPTAATIANSWDPALGEEIGQALGEEAAEQDVNVLLGPGLNMKRNSLCGRNFEYFSEDPCLAGKLAAAYIRGIQSKGVSACPKHFAVNSQETRRMASDSIIDERTLREVYLTGFEIAVKEGKPWSIMTSYNSVNGAYANENEHLLQDILRKEWGFDGAVITDWGGSNDHALGVKNGSTLEMPTPGPGSARDLKKALKNGTIQDADINARLEELLTLIDKTTGKHGASAGKEAHHALARKAAGESIVLLKNDNGLLPLKPGTKTAVIGDFAVAPRYQGAGSSTVNATKVENTLDCLKAAELNIIGYAQGFLRKGGADEELKNDAVKLASNADVVLLFLGQDEVSESEGKDRQDMRLSQNQLDLIDAVAAANPNVAVILSGGSPVEIPWLSKCRALVHGYLSGQAGAGAMADVLTGKRSPSGKLAETWPVSYFDTPSAGNYPAKDRTAEYREGPYIGYRYYEKAGVAVRFPFGYGLSYTTFSYGRPSVTDKEVSFSVTNTGNTAGAEIVQLYVGKKDSRLYGPDKQLKGFSKVFLKPGETRTVTIPLDDKAFRYFNVRTNRWETEGGTYQIYLAASSEDIRQTAEISVKGTGAACPYDREKLPNYYAGTVQNVPDSEFELILGRKIPESKVAIDRNITFGDLNHGRSPIFWLVWLVIKLIRDGNEKKGKTDLNILFIYNMPLRALAKMTGGMVDMAMVDGLVLEIRGFWIIGIVWCLIAFVKNLIQNALMNRKVR